MQVNDLRPGHTFIYEGNLYIVISNAFSKTGRQQGKVTLKVKNLKTGSRVELTFTGGDKLEKAMIEKKDMQYLYNDGTNCYLMDSESYDQVEIPTTNLKWELNFIKESAIIQMTKYQEEVIGITIPDKVELVVVETEPAVKGDTTSGAQKKAKLETGWELLVPLFIKINDIILVNTDDGKYSGRVN
ncbi:elongation factor P [Spiroplasma endosymbiont of Aspidapion aeneum]|uniref:elongation factor P n=1 Tax=Spiroplasma endosymbiont of Aspidapion aeneum TaxID=3066276 RepID=UPI00313ACC3D